ncbi:MAG: phosphomannomutase/phosphoglucomutase [Minisyncoccales bacterium]
MKINLIPTIFRTYDIRGIYPIEINEQTAYLIGRAFVRFLKQKNKKKLRVIVGQDNRVSSNNLFQALTRGLFVEDVEVINLGLCTSPMFYWVGGKYQFAGGIYITASHNPPNYNGFKFIKQGAVPISGQSGLLEIKKLASSIIPEVRRKKGKIINKNYLNDYLQFNFSFFQKKQEKKRPSLRIVIDTANAVPSILIPKLFKKINRFLPIKCQIYHLFSELNGLFPNHLPDPLKKENLKVLCSTVKRKKADLGVAFDGDGDRIVFVDERGRRVSGDLITGLISQLILREKGGGKFLYDIRSSNSVEEIIKETGGQPIVWKIGHSLIKEKMRKEKIIFGGELSGHYYHQDYYFAECPIFVLLKTLESISNNYPKPFSQIIKPFQRYFHSGEINFKIKKLNLPAVREKLLARLANKFSKGEISKLDGLRIDFSDWWFLVRPSNTEPVMRLVVEAKERNLMKEKIQEIKSIIREIQENGKF